MKNGRKTYESRINVVLLHYSLRKHCHCYKMKKYIYIYTYIIYIIKYNVISPDYETNVIQVFNFYCTQMSYKSILQPLRIFINYLD